MAGKWMNRFFYGQAGKGDYRRENLPTTRWQLFVEMLGVRFSALVRLNLIYMVSWLPAMLVLLRGVMNLLSLMMNAQPMEDVQAALLGTLWQLAPCVAVTGPATAGISYVTRNWARDEHAFPWTDFKDAVKANWKQSLAVSAITGMIWPLAYLGWLFYGQLMQQQALMLLPRVLLAVAAAIWSLAVMYMHPMIVSYQMPLKTVVRNALLLAVGRLPASVGIRLVLLVPALLALGATWWASPFLVSMALLLYYVFIGFGLSHFITASYTNAVFDRFINSRIEGASVNRGLRPEHKERGTEE